MAEGTTQGSTKVEPKAPQGSAPAAYQPLETLRHEVNRLFDN